VVGRAAVLGRPVKHSLSPVLHRAAYAALGLDWTYEALDCGCDELAAVLASRPGWAGFSCTMPLKHAALRVADEASSLARVVGAANTLLPRETGGWRADNTDVAGIVGALSDLAAPVPERVTVLGAGGTAQAAMAALARLGRPNCTVLVRDPARSQALTATAQRLGVGVVIDGLSVDAPALAADLVVSTLPPGAADALASRPWTDRQMLLDVVYDPWPTKVAAAVAAAGGAGLSGALMLLHQAGAQVELMTGHPAPLDAMRSALAAAAPGCGV
jgi:shikimate dehydrogenase